MKPTEEATNQRRRLGSAAPSLMAALALAPLALAAGCSHSNTAAQPTSAVEHLPPPPEADLHSVRRVAGREVAAQHRAGDIADLVERIAPAVVSISTVEIPTIEGMQGRNPLPWFFGRPGTPMPEMRPAPRQGAGSGFIVDADGLVVTNYHVVDGATEVRVRLADDRELEAKVVGRDAKADLALLQLEGVHDLPAVTLGSSKDLRVGDEVIAVGNPFGLGQTVTRGIVSAKARTIGAGPYDDFIQTDASINPGNSGGPLFDLNGEVVGINAAIHAGGEGIGFAIPVDTLRDELGQLKTVGHVERGKLGLAFQPVDQPLAKALGIDSPRGALVTTIERHSPADQAGIRAGDLIVAVDGVAIARAEELPRNVARHAPGTAVAIGLLRRGKPLTVTATLARLESEEVDSATPTVGSAPSSTLAEIPGVELRDSRGGGALVTRTSPVGEHGSDLRAGDVITEVGGKPARNLAELRALLAAAHGSAVLCKVRRGGHDYFVGVAPAG